MLKVLNCENLAFSDDEKTMINVTQLISLLSQLEDDFQQNKQVLENLQKNNNKLERNLNTIRKGLKINTKGELKTYIK